jgi:hypothetical protein
MNGRSEVPCPICGVTIHPQFKTEAGEILNYCSPSNTVVPLPEHWTLEQ